MFLLSYSLNLILPQLNTAYFGPIWFTSDNMDSHWFNTEINAADWSEGKSCELVVLYLIKGLNLAVLSIL